MFFNLDRNSKQSLFNQFKQDALDYRQKKNLEKQRRIQEEREYLAKREQQEKEADERIFKEKLQRKNAQREEYNSMLMKTKKNIPGYRHYSNLNKDVVLNNWGGQEKSHQITQIPQTNPQSSPQQNNLNKEFNTLPQGKETSWKGRKIYKNEDHLGNYLNDDRNDQELNKYINNEKEYKQKMYKDLLYSQFQEATNKNLNLYGTNDPLIVERKRKRYLSQDPFAKNNNYDFSKSNLMHNPIVDPQNNLEYNKYLKFSESQRNMANRNYQINNSSFQYQPNNNNIKLNNIDNYSNLNNNSNNNTNYNPLEEFKSNNYDTSNMSKGIKINNNFIRNIKSENNNINIKNNYNNINNSFRNEENQKGQNQNSGYANNQFRPTPSGERIRQAAASNFF
jgi:hypothetical protein